MAPGRIPFQELDPGRTELRRARQELLAIVRCLEQWRHFLEARATRLRYGRTTGIWNISGPPRTSTGGKRDGPFTFPASTTPSITTRDPQWANRTHSLVERTTDADKRITRELFSLTRPCSKSTPFAPRSYEDRKVDILRDIRECMEEEGTTEEPVAAAAQRLRRARATGQVHKTEWDETDGGC